MKRGTVLLCLLLFSAWAMPLFALAPQSALPRKEESAVALDKIAKTKEFQKRSKAFLKAMDEPPMGILAQRILRKDGAILSKMKEPPAFQFDEFGYRVFPLGDGRVYLKAKVVNGPQSGLVFYCVLGGKPALAAPFDSRGMNQYLMALEAPAKVSASFRPALAAYSAGRKLLSERKLSPEESLREKVFLAGKVFQDFRLTPEDWREFMFRTVLRDVSLEFQCALALLYGLFHSQDVGAYLEKNFPQAVFGPALFADWAFDFGGRGYENLITQEHRKLFERIAKASGISPEERDTLSQLLLQSPWGQPAYFPVPEWMKKISPDDPMERPELPKEFINALVSRNTTPQELQRMAQPGYLDAYRNVLKGMLAMETEDIQREQELSDQVEMLEIQPKANKARLQEMRNELEQIQLRRDADRDSAKMLRLVDKIRDDMRYLEDLHKALEKAAGAGSVLSLRIVREVQEPSKDSVGASILEARKSVVEMKRMFHITANIVGTVIGYLRLLEDKLKTDGTLSADMQKHLRTMLEEGEAYLDFLRKTIPKEEVQKREQAEKILQDIPIAVEKAHKNLERMLSQYELHLSRPGALPDLKLTKGHSNEYLLQNLTKMPEKITQAAKIMRRYFPGREKDQNPPEWVDLRSVITEEAVRQAFGAEYLVNVDLAVKSDPDLREVFLQKEVFWDRILGQLISNAGQAMGGDKPVKPGEPVRGTLSLSLRNGPEGRTVEISVEDTGKGIFRSHIHRIFERGFTLGKEKGTGIGLDEAKEWVQKFGGTMWVRSVLDKGTRFVMALPTREAVRLGTIRTRPELTVPALATVRETLPYLGNSGNEALRKFADEAASRSLERYLRELDVEGSILSTIPAGTLRSGESVGKGGMPVSIMAEPLVQTYGIVHPESKDTQTLLLYADPRGMMRLPPDLYLRKIIVGKDAAGAGIDVAQTVGENLHRIANKLTETRAKEEGAGIETADLKGAVLFKSRHRSLIRDMIRAGMRVHRTVNPADEEDFQTFWEEVHHKTKNGEDYRSGNVWFLAKKDVAAVHGLYTGELDFVVGADGTMEGLAAAALTEVYGGEMSSQLAAREKLNDEVLNADLQTQYGNFTRKERDSARNYGFVHEKTTRKDLGFDEFLLNQKFTSFDLVNSAELLLVAGAVKDSSWMPELTGVRVDKDTGDITQRMLVAPRGGPVRIVEAVYAGDYLQRERRIEEERDAGEKAALCSDYAMDLAKDGVYGQALHAMGQAIDALSDVNPFAARLDALRGLQLLVLRGGHEKEAMRYLEGAIAIAGKDPTGLGLESLLRTMSEKSSKTVIEGGNYQFEYDEDTGQTALNLFDVRSGDHFVLPVSLGFKDAAGKTFRADEYFQSKPELVEGPNYKALNMHHFGSKNMPEISVLCKFPAGAPYFIMELRVRNTTPLPIDLRQWHMFSSENVSLGPRAENLSYSRIPEMGVWTHVITRLALALGFAGWEPGSENIAYREGEPARILASADAGGVRVEPGAIRGSGELLVFVDQNDLYAAPGYALWNIARRMPVSGEVSARVIGRNFTMEQRLSLAAALILEGHGKTWKPQEFTLPPDLLEMLTAIARQPAGKLRAVDRPGEDAPYIFVVPLGIGDKPDWMAVLFNFTKNPRNLTLQFTDMPLDFKKQYRFTDLTRQESGILEMRHMWYNVPPGGVRIAVVHEAGKTPPVRLEKMLRQEQVQSGAL